MISKDKNKPGGRKPAGKAASKPRKPAAELQAAANPAEPERVSKLLARAGIASRRDIERMIAEGRIRLNGEVLATPAINASFADAIEVDGEPVTGIERTRLWLYHKPAGLVTTNRDPEGRPTVFERLPKALPRVMTVGRLDINTEGLLLLTNDGGLARVLELPTTGWLRRYRVRAHGDIDQARLDKLKDGIAVDGVLYGGIEATLDREQGSNVWITMSLREGKNREIKNVLGALGLEVNRLIRISYGPFQLSDLPEGHVVEVRGRMLRDQLGPRLIEEAGADFEAPIIHQAAGDPEDGESPAPRRPQHEKPAERNERLRARLDTRRDGAGRDERPGKRGKHGEAPRDRKPGTEAGKDGPRKPAGPQRRRASNVWIAPGARPMGPKRAAEKADADRRQAEKDAKRDARGGRTDRPQRDGKPGPGRRARDDDRPRAAQPRGHDTSDANRPQRRTERGETRDTGRPERGRGEPSFGRGDRPRSGPARASAIDSDRPYRSDRPAGGKGPGARGPARGAAARSEATGEGRPRGPGRPGGGPGKPVRGKGGGAGKPGGRPGGPGKPGGRPGGKPGGGGPDRPRGPKPPRGPGNADRRR